MIFLVRKENQFCFLYVLYYNKILFINNSVLKFDYNSALSITPPYHLMPVIILVIIYTLSNNAICVCRFVAL